MQLPDLDRRWDFAFVVGVIALIMGAAHVNNMLLAGDWSFWADWKDRQWWPLITPAVNMVLPAFVQYIAWTRFRLPVGATAAAICLVLAQWFSRIVNFEGWAHLPLNYTWPETMVLLGILLDVTLLLSRSMIITSAVGALFWGGLFYAANWPALAPYLQPVIMHGQVMTAADAISFSIPRSQGPEYLRMIEQGHLRALVGDVTIVVSFFAAMVSAVVYWIGVGIGHIMAILPIKTTFKLTSD